MVRGAPPVVAWLALLMCLLCTAAVYAQDADLEPESEFHIKLSNETTSNLYSSGTEPESATMFKINLYGSMEYPLDPGRKYTVDLDVLQADYQKQPEEDYKEINADFGYEHEFSEHTSASLSYSHEFLNGTSESFNTVSGRDYTLEARLNRVINDQDSASVSAWTGKEYSKGYESLNNEAGGMGVTLSRDLGAFTYVSVGYESETVDYPNEFIIGFDELETTTHRTDKTSTFSASVSRVFSIYPLAYAQVQFEQADTSTNSNGYYLWYDTVSGGLPTKVVPGYDAARDNLYSFFGLKDIDEKTTLSLYYMMEKIRYPNRFVGNYGDAEPTAPQYNTLTYLYVSLQHRIADNLTLELLGSWLSSRSNEDLYNYHETTSSLGFISNF